MLYTVTERARQEEDAYKTPNLKENTGKDTQAVSESRSHVQANKPSLTLTQNTHALPLPSSL